MNKPVAQSRLPVGGRRRNRIRCTCTSIGMLTCCCFWPRDRSKVVTWPAQWQTSIWSERGQIAPPRDVGFGLPMPALLSRTRPRTQDAWGTNASRYRRMILRSSGQLTKSASTRHSRVRPTRAKPFALNAGSSWRWKASASLIYAAGDSPTRPRPSTDTSTAREAAGEDEDKLQSVCGRVRGETSFVPDPLPTGRAEQDGRYGQSKAKYRLVNRPTRTRTGRHKAVPFFFRSRSAGQAIAVNVS